MCNQDLLMEKAMYCINSDFIPKVALRQPGPFSLSLFFSSKNVRKKRKIGHEMEQSEGCQYNFAPHGQRVSNRKAQEPLEWFWLWFTLQ